MANDPHSDTARNAAPRSNDPVEVRYPVDLVPWLSQLAPPEALSYFKTLDVQRRTKVLQKLPPDSRLHLARSLTESDLAAIVTLMHADNRADLYKQLTEDEQTALLQHLGAPVAADIARLSAYAEESAGALMTTDYATLGRDMTAKQAIEALRSQAPAKETIYRSYIVDADERLIGSVRLHSIILAPEEAVIGSLMETSPVSVALDTDQEEVGKLIARYDLLAIPVVDPAGRLVGIVTHDDATDVMQAEATEDFQKMSTILPFSQNMRQAGIGVLYSRRIVWLALLIFGNLFSGAGIAYFEEMILAYVSLVFFLPLLIDSSGNAGSQSATLMVRALATGDVQMKDWGALILRELAVAAALGATMALVVFPVGIWRGGAEVALTVGLTMFAVVMIGSLVGMSLPFLLHRMKLDPATASGPLVTTLSDGMGVLIYFSIATAVLGS